MKHCRIHKLVHTLIASILMAVFLCPSYVLASTTSNKKSKPWATAYKKIVKQLDKEYSDSYNKVTYDLIYFNKDKTPELVAGINGYWVSMYTYDKGKVYTVMDQWAYGAMGNAGYSYFPKKNILVNYNSDFAGASVYTYYGKMKNHKIVDYYKQVLRMDCFIDKNKNGMPDDNEFLDDKWVYYYGDKKISEKKYNSMLIDGEPESIYGSLSKKQILKKLNK